MERLPGGHETEHVHRRRAVVSDSDHCEGDAKLTLAPFRDSSRPEQATSSAVPWAYRSFVTMQTSEHLPERGEVPALLGPPAAKRAPRPQRQPNDHRYCSYEDMHQAKQDVDG